MTNAVSRGPVTSAETRARSLVSPCQMCRGQSGPDTDFFSSTFFPVDVIPPMPPTHIYLHVAVTRRIKELNREPSKSNAVSGI